MSDWPSEFLTSTYWLMIDALADCGHFATEPAEQQEFRVRVFKSYWNRLSAPEQEYARKVGLTEVELEALGSV